MKTPPVLRYAALLGGLVLTACDSDPADVASDPLGRELRSLASAYGAVALEAPQAEPAPLVELGRLLFFDKILSGNRNISCGTCHHPVAFTGDALPVSLGQGSIGTASQRQQAEGAMIPRNAPPIFNGSQPSATHMFWDSRVREEGSALVTPDPGLNGPDAPLPEAGPLDSPLAAQAMFPVTSREEMRGHPGENELADAEGNGQIWRALMTRLLGTATEPGSGFETYRRLFREAYPEVPMFALTFGHAARAIAAFEGEAWRAVDTPFDRFLRGDASALSEEEKRGGILFFGAARCAECHSGPLLTDQEHHAMAVPQVGPGKLEEAEDRGLALLTDDPADNYRFRTPPLRNVALTGPWMHDGAFTDLRAAVVHMVDPEASFMAYDGSELPLAFQATVDRDTGRNQARMEALDPVATPVPLTDEEIDELVAFLHALTDPASLNLLGDIPPTVPSGLPVRD